MKLSRIFWILLTATAVGLVSGIAFSGDSLVSVEAWVGASLIVIASVAVGELLRVSQIEPATLVSAWAGEAVDPPTNTPREFQNLRSALVSAQLQSGSFERSLRPRLQELADHHIPRRHGIDIEDADQLGAILGDVAWLVDDDITDRTPTPDDLESFVTLLEESNT